MSEARWCDYGDHAYKGGREGTIMLGQSVVHESRYSGPQLEQEVQEMCPECAAELGLLKNYEAPPSPAARHKAILGKVAEESKQ